MFAAAVLLHFLLLLTTGRAGNCWDLEILISILQAYGDSTQRSKTSDPGPDPFPFPLASMSLVLDDF